MGERIEKVNSGCLTCYKYWKGIEPSDGVYNLFAELEKRTRKTQGEIIKWK